MPFTLTSDQDLIRRTVREAVEPLRGKPAEHIDRERAWPGEALRQLAPLGLGALLVPADQGGSGTDTVSYALALEEVARASGVVALALNNANALGTYALARAASPELLSTVLPPLVAFDQHVAWALTEPNSGSDVSAVSTRARRDGDDHILNGLKSFVVGAPHASWLIVFAKVPGTEGLTAFLVAADAPGVRVAPREASMTMRGADMAQVFLTDVHVPATHRLGEEGAGGDLARECGELAALGGAAIAVGLMQAAFEDSVAYTGEREQFRLPIKKFQAIQFLVADLDVKLRASRLMTYAAADARDRGEPASADIAAAKLMAGEASKVLTQKALRIHGGTGFMRDLPVERYNRDARAVSIYAGTSEAQRAILAAQALGL